MKQSHYERYITLSNQIADLEAARKVVGELLSQEMEEKQMQKIEGELGIITMAERPKYVYTEKVDALAKALKDAKKQEETDGTAKKEVTKFLRVTLR